MNQSLNLTTFISHRVADEDAEHCIRQLFAEYGTIDRIDILKHPSAHVDRCAFSHMSKVNVYFSSWNTTHALVKRLHVRMTRGITTNRGCNRQYQGTDYSWTLKVNNYIAREYLFSDNAWSFDKL
jgi:hypothetical protein